MNDRLADLRAGATSPDMVAVDISDPREGVEMRGTKAEDSKFMQEFFESVDMVKSNIVHIKNATKRNALVNKLYIFRLNMYIFSLRYWRH